MSYEVFIGSDEERAATQIIAQASTILDAHRGDLPPRFVDMLFERVAPEDLAVYEPRELAMLAESAYEFLKVRVPGRAKIRIYEPSTSPSSGTLGQVSVIEVINDNMPFLVDSVMGELTEQGYEPRLVAHPIFSVSREGSGQLDGLASGSAQAAYSLRESFIHIHIDRIEGQIKRETIQSSLDAVLADVHVSVADWQAMRSKVTEAVSHLDHTVNFLPREDVDEARQFLNWLLDNNFTFLGVRDYSFVGSPETGELEPDFETGLGLLRSKDVRVLRRGNELVSITPEIREFLLSPVPLIITKANVRSRVHRRIHMDYVGIKRFSPEGQMLGELRVIGLFTATAYTKSVKVIPFIRRKVENILKRAGFDADSHSGKALVNVLEGYPRDDLFQIDEELLFRFAMAILQLDERPRIRVLYRRDKFDRFVSVLVYLPRDRYDTRSRSVIGAYLADVFDGQVRSFSPYLPEGALARVHFIIGRHEGHNPDPERSEIEAAVADITRTWGDGLLEALVLAHEPVKGRHLYDRYAQAFNSAYCEAYTPPQAISDIRALEGLSIDRPIAIDFYNREGDEPGKVGLKVYSRAQPISLSARVPVLENMGFDVVDERTYRIAPGTNELVWLHDMTLTARGDAAPNYSVLDQRLEAALMAILRGRAENDGYNALVLVCGLAWRDIALLRTVSRYLRQIGLPFSQDYMWSTLLKHHAVATKIVALFHARFDPRLKGDAAERQSAQDVLKADIETLLDGVQSLDEDRILRHFVNVVLATMRTNFFQLCLDGLPKSVISLKLDCRKVDGLPLPRPMYEVFVYSPRVEGIHLRFGKVARGGLRWSDRPQDFRTEVLGLVKAQQVKNAVIVPVGAKGGFVPKKLPVGGSRDAIQAEGMAAYDLFISSLLDLTDNITPDGLVPPENVVRHDEDDPYLVVAADKGTATFSDYANSISQRYGFWLDDAFASGGSVGYDHKKMGITARGGWEAVKRHFREMDVNIAVTPFTVAGVGDMSGDVFGNGMLLEKTIKLVAAFDHRDIFIDPSPDPAASWTERKRLFDLPRSSWQDYDKGLISQGGGVYPRSAKSIALSPQAREMLGIAQAEVTPVQLMSAILRMKVDLLWFGGIGTYIRSSTESDDQVGDRANDALRIAGRDVRARVIGEGANLGVTQRGRIEAALAGVRLNTDAIDNSAGVNSSDVEVNIKIALSQPVRDGQLVQEDRNRLLAEMTDDVAHLVLRNNYLQTLSLSLAQRRGLEDMGFQQLLMQMLEGRGLLDRHVEWLPDDLTLQERRRQGQPLTRPELAVLLAYGKISLYNDLLASSLPDDPYLAAELVRYFPVQLQKRFPEAIAHHRLGREIISTNLANSIINRGGPSFIARVVDQTGADSASIGRAFVVVREAFGLTALNNEIDALDTRVSGKVQLELYAAVENLLRSRVIWMLRNTDTSSGLEGLIQRFKAGVDAIGTDVLGVVDDDTLIERGKRVSAYTQEGVPESLAVRVADLGSVAMSLDSVLVSERTGKSIPEVMSTLSALAQLFSAARLKSVAQGLVVTGRYERLALDRAVDGFDLALRRLAVDVLSHHGAGDAGVMAWFAERRIEIERVQKFLAEINAGAASLSQITVAESMISDLVRG